MSDAALRARAAAVAGNLALFYVLVTRPAFQAAHHHWIFPLLAVFLLLQWAATLALPPRPLDPAALRASVLSLLAFLLVLGIVRHATILACFDRCSFKLAAANLLALPLFLLHGRRGEPGFWTRQRCELAALGAALWAGYLALRGFGAAVWAMNLACAIVMLLLWLRREKAPALIASVAIAAALAARATGDELVIIGFSLAWSVFLPLWLAPAVHVWLEQRTAPPAAGVSAVRITLTVLVLVGIGKFIAGPTALVTDPAKRRAHLAAFPKPAPQDPAKLSPAAQRLRGHVVMLAATIGERDAYGPKKDKARDYLLSQFKALGYAPELQPYESRFLGGVPNGRRYDNVLATLPALPAGGAPWVVGAHYDSAPGTPGADDDASGVAVLLETARLLKGRKLPRDVRFVAFGTEEPPAFGTNNMGSAHHARSLKDGGVTPYGMISLEMLGYYNDAKGSQLYPPVMQLFYPDRGDYLGVVSNVSSRGLLKTFAAAWRAASGLPLVTSVLPGPLSGLALSDQLNYWDQGFPALMLSDTAFYRNPCYHEDCDRPETLDYERMAQAAEALAAALSAP